MRASPSVGDGLLRRSPSGRTGVFRRPNARNDVSRRPKIRGRATSSLRGAKQRSNPSSDFPRGKSALASEPFCSRCRPRPFTSQNSSRARLSSLLVFRLPCRRWSDSASDGDAIARTRSTASGAATPSPSIRGSELPTISCQNRATASGWRGFGTGERPGSD
jgi:hypothetical protein